LAIPLVSVLMPVRNGEHYLAAALDSVLGERDPILEVIVIDDGSTDGTVAMLEDRRRRDPRVIIVTQPASGLVAALERGRRYARAALIARLDADDIAYPGRLQAQWAAFDANPDLVLLGTALDRIDARGRPRGVIAYPTDSAVLAAKLPTANVFSHSSVMMRRSAVESAGGYRQFFVGAEDYDLWLRLSERGKIANLAARLGAYRVHGNSVTARSALRQAFSAALARLCAALRRAGKPDPSIGREDPIDLREPVSPGDPLAPVVRLFQALAFAEAEAFAWRRPTDEDAALLTLPSLAHAEKQLAQTALARMVRRRALPPALSYSAALSAIFRLNAARGLTVLLRPEAS